MGFDVNADIRSFRVLPWSSVCGLEQRCCCFLLGYFNVCFDFPCSLQLISSNYLVSLEFQQLHLSSATRQRGNINAWRKLTIISLCSPMVKRLLVPLRSALLPFLVSGLPQKSKKSRIAFTLRVEFSLVVYTKDVSVLKIVGQHVLQSFKYLSYY